MNKNFIFKNNNNEILVKLHLLSLKEGRTNLRRKGKEREMKATVSEWIRGIPCPGTHGSSGFTWPGLWYLHEDQLHGFQTMDDGGRRSSV